MRNSFLNLTEEETEDSISENTYRGESIEGFYHRHRCRDNRNKSFLF